MVWSMPDTASSGSYLSEDLKISFSVYGVTLLIRKDATSTNASLS